MTEYDASTGASFYEISNENYRPRRLATVPTSIYDLGSDRIIIGSTVAAMFYAVRVLANDPTLNVYILVEGDNNLCIPGVDDANYGNEAVNDSRFFRSYNMSVVTEDYGAFNTQIRVPYGLSSEAIAAYPSIVQYPPMLNPTQNTAAATLVRRLTERDRFDTSARANAASLAAGFGVPLSSGVITDGPSVQDAAYNFVRNYEEDGVAEREVGQQAYDTLVNGPFSGRCTFYFGCSNIVFTGVNYDTRICTVTFNQQVSVGGQRSVPLTGRLYLKGTVYDNLRIASEGGLTNIRGFVNTIRPPSGVNTVYPNLSTYIPVIYRNIYSIPIDAAGEMNQRFNMVLPSIRTGSRNTTRAWIVQIFITDYDARDGYRALSGQALCIIEALSYNNRRILSWDRSANSFVSCTNTNAAENVFIEELNNISATILRTFGVLTLPPPLVPMTSTTGLSRTGRHVSVVNSFIPNTFMMINECVALFEPTVQAVGF